MVEPLCMHATVVAAYDYDRLNGRVLRLAGSPAAAGYEGISGRLEVLYNGESVDSLMGRASNH